MAAALPDLLHLLLGHVALCSKVVCEKTTLRKRLQKMLKKNFLGSVWPIVSQKVLWARHRY